MANTYLTRSAGGGSSTKKATYSMWIKRSKIGTTQQLHNFYNGTNDYTKVYFNDTDTIIVKQKDGSNTHFQVSPNNVLRDTSAWYHLCVVIDTTLSTTNDRLKIYINGVRTDSFSTNSQPSENRSLKPEAVQNIGYLSGGSEYFDGLLSYVAYIDGYAESPNIFGETDSTTGEWKIKTSITPSTAWGSRGFFILKNGNSVTDQSGNSNNFTLGGGTLTNTKDCPSNVFATWNPVFMPYNLGNGRADNGGTTIGSPGGDSSSLASMGARSGKYYWEIRVQNAANTRSCGIVRSDIQGVSSTEPIYPGGNGNASNFTSAYNMVNGYVQTNTAGTQAQQGSLATLTTGDFLGVALDIDNLDIKWYKNGSLVTTTSLTSAWIEKGLFILPCNRLDGNQFVEYNFGNGCFGSTQLTGTTYQATGLGIFKYQPPTGFTALSTKGLNL